MVQEGRRPWGRNQSFRGEIYFFLFYPCSFEHFEFALCLFLSSKFLTLILSRHNLVKFKMTTKKDLKRKYLQGSNLKRLVAIYTLSPVHVRQQWFNLSIAFVCRSSHYFSTGRGYNLQIAIYMSRPRFEGCSLNGTASQKYWIGWDSENASCSQKILLINLSFILLFVQVILRIF